MNIAAKTMCLVTVAAFCAIGVIASGNEAFVSEEPGKTTDPQLLAQCVVTERHKGTSSILVDPVYNPTSTAR